MVSTELFINKLQQNGVDFFAGVPDSLLKNICAYITDHIPSDHNIITANEGAAVAIGAGHYLATGGIPLIYMQNSGIGNAVNPLLSLADEKVYSIPMILLIGWRGEPGGHDEPQHVKQGEVTIPMLNAMGVKTIILPDEDAAAASAAEMAVINARREARPYALIIKKGTFGKYKLQNEAVNTYSLSREYAMKCVIDNISSDSAVVSTTGKLSRELFEYRETRHESHERDFLTVGSMGHASSIALGIALSHPERKVFCFDGDGAFIMHMGALSNIGKLAPGNFIHLLFNNGAHESVGGQPTLGFEIDILAIARACGYANAVSVETEEDLISALGTALDSEKPVLIEIKVGINSREDLGRPTTTPIQNKNAFMHFLSE